MNAQALKAPFPWFGGKSRAAELVWKALGDVPNYVEPFAGSLAVLLGRPTPPVTETVNDADCYLANFWRALAAAPEEVERWCDSPINEADLSARHQWLVDQVDFREQMKSDPHFYDAKIAGWWVWGVCLWIGDGWCDTSKATVGRQLPAIGGHLARGVHLNHGGPDLGALAARLRRVRVACGDWKRITGPSITHELIPGGKLTGVFLDPPYAEGAIDYSVGGRNISAEVRAWAIEAGEHPLMRVVLAGYEGEHDMPAGWRKVEWKARGGYGNQSADGNDNARRERLWLSPACLGDDGPAQRSLFGGAR